VIFSQVVYDCPQGLLRGAHRIDELLDIGPILGEGKLFQKKPGRFPDSPHFDFHHFCKNFMAGDNMKIPIAGEDKDDDQRRIKG